MMLTFHLGLEGAPFPWTSPAWAWPVVKRPVVFAFDDEGGRFTEVLAMGNPVVWIPALVAIVVLAAWWVRRRDMSLPDGTILAGFAAAYVPWLALTQHRSFVFIFYLLPAVPFLILALVRVGQWLVHGRRWAMRYRRGSPGRGAGALRVLLPDRRVDAPPAGRVAVADLVHGLPCRAAHRRPTASLVRPGPTARGVVLDLSAEPIVHLPVRRIRSVLLVLVLVLLVLDEGVLASRFFLGHARLGGLYGLFDLDVETSVSTFVQSSLLAGRGGPALAGGPCRAQGPVDGLDPRRGDAVGRRRRGEPDPRAVRSCRSTGSSIRGASSGTAGSIPGMVVAGGVVVLTIRLLRVLDRDVALLLALGGGIYLLGVLGVEMAGGAWLDGGGSETVYRMVFTSIEETLEGVGIVVAVAALLEAVRRASPRVIVDLTP